ncbi:MAG: ABC transporter permease, partial [Spirochaetota bacterium]
MYQYILRRLLLTIPVVIGVSIIVFSIIRLLPGDPARALAGVQATPEYVQQVRERYGLDEPIPVQYWNFISSAARGDLGVSTFSRRPVTTELGERFPRTLVLAGLSLFLATVVGVSAGIVSATKRNSIFD